MHGGEHLRVLTHAEIIVGAPHGDIVAAIVVAACGGGELAGVTFEIGEDAVTALRAQGIELL
jgi:hypothetical protein